MLKGRSNYLCRAKLRAAGAPDALFEQPVGRDFGRQLERLRTFADDSETGDRSEFDDDIDDATWAAVSCTSVECPGKADCADGGECFAELARDRAQEASILVVNHALYCAHLAVGRQRAARARRRDPRRGARVPRERDERVRGRHRRPTRSTRLSGMLGARGSRHAPRQRA